MPPIDDIDEFLSRITPTLELELAKSGATRELVVVEDRDGIAVAEAVSSLADHDLLRRHVEGGAEAAAYINYLADRNEAFARVLLTAPPNSDTRRASVTRTSTAVVLGPWRIVLPG